MSRRIPAGRAMGAGLMLLVAASLVAPLAAARGLAATPPQGADLSGTWTLNVALSDDPKKILEAERAKARAPRGEPAWLKQRRLRNDESGGIDMPAQVTIAHSADRFLISSPAPSGEIYKSEYRAGSRSVVSVATGVADREMGWKGKSFVISTRAVEGIRREDRYSLDKDGRLLVVTETRGADVPKRAVKRVYDRESMSR